MSDRDAPRLAAIAFNSRIYRFLPTFLYEQSNPDSACLKKPTGSISHALRGWSGRAISAGLKLLRHIA
jgi:hypothetical protein